MNRISTFLVPFIESMNSDDLIRNRNIDGQQMNRETLPVATEIGENTDDASIRSNVAAAGMTDGIGAAEGLFGTENDVNRDGEMRQIPIHLNLSRASDRMKLLIPFSALLILKLLFDHVITVILVFTCIASLKSIRSAFDMQLSLKERASNKEMCLLLGRIFILIVVVVMVISMTEYKQEFVNRVMLQIPDENVKSIGLFDILWCCIITDTVLQSVVLTLKMITILSISWYWHTFRTNQPVLDHSSRCLRLESCCSKNRRRRSSNRDNEYSDIESGISGRIRSEALNAGAIGSEGFLSAPSGWLNAANAMLGGAHQLSASGSMTSRRLNRSGVAVDTVDENEALISSGVARSHQHHDEVLNTASDVKDDSDVSHSIVDAGEYLFKLRICMLVDIFGLLYRTAVPFPLWFHYFSTGRYLAMILKLFYTGLKVMDFTRKAHGLMVAIEFLVSNKIEYGHYTTEAEMQLQEGAAAQDWDHDCPVCFDRPTKPVTLDCTHIFCEMCIAEWLDKEKTCPVCRADVKCSSPLLGAVKKDAAEPFPIIM